MSAAPSNRSKTVSAAEPAALMSETVARTPVADGAGDSPAPVATVRETMAAVISAVEAFEQSEAAGRKSVDLQFRVGDEHLAVRVEVRDGTIHTTFRTDSGDLRHALSQEWQSVMQSGTPREMRLAEPVFSHSTAGNGETLSGSLRQGTPQRQAQPAPEHFSFSRGPGFAAAGPPPPPTATISSGSNLLLNAFA